ncbi:MAG: DMT family transporter [Gammaproteobacteria bacterium]|nr:DMT family transporter [Gammaproteobacteria bacterium]
MSVPFAYLGVILIWSTTPLAVKWSSVGGSFLFGVASRNVVGLLLGMALLLALRIPLTINKHAWRAYVSVGVTLYLGLMGVYFGAQFVPSGLISVLYGWTPFFIAVFALLWFGENNFSVGKSFGMLLGISGLVVIFSDSLQLGESALLGITAVLLSVAVHAFGSLWFKRVHVEGLSAMAVTVGGLWVSLPLFLLSWWLLDGSVPSEPPSRTIAAIVYLGVFGSVLGAMLYFYALHHLGAMSMSLLTLITPVAALVLGVVANDEHISTDTLYGVALILWGLVMFQFEGIRRRWSLYRMRA